MMKVIEKADVELMIPHARSVAAMYRPAVPLSSADDCSIGGLASAHVNWGMIKGNAPGHYSWCKCNPEGEQHYFRNKDTGFHGWMCGKCFGITQTG